MIRIAQSSERLRFATREFGFPLHRLNLPGFAAWEASPIGRRAIAIALKKEYGGEVGIVAPQPMYLVAHVSRSGVVTPMNKPHKIVNFWEIANAPDTHECFCQEFVDHESGERWDAKRSGGPETATHHPFCQFEPVCAPNFGEVAMLGNKQRPDNWDRNRYAIRERVGLG